MAEMIERVARAIYRAEARAAHYSQDQIDAWEQYPQSVRDKWAETAKAAIEAMREPTEAMERKAGNGATGRGRGDWYVDGPADVWRTMIDVATEPETTT